MSVREFLAYLASTHATPRDLSEGLEAPKKNVVLPRVLDEETTRKILEAAGGATPRDLRDRAMLEVLYGCGLRVSEAVGLQKRCLFLDEGMVQVVGKGDKERLVPIGEAASDALLAYFEAIPMELSSSGNVFINRYGSPLSRVSAFKTVKKMALLSGVRKEISPHTFRHSFATHLIENGADIRFVQEMLGHESVSTTEIYTHIDSTTWHSAILDHHPRR